jgi:heat shock protein HtpX
MEMCVDNPHSGFVDIFSTHPSIEKRVAALVQTAGGRDPGPIPSIIGLDEPATGANEDPFAERPVKKAPPPVDETGPWDTRPALGGNPLDPWQWGPWGPRKNDQI